MNEARELWKPKSAQECRTAIEKRFSGRGFGITITEDGRVMVRPGDNSGVSFDGRSANKLGDVEFFRAIFEKLEALELFLETDQTESTAAATEGDVGSAVTGGTEAGASPAATGGAKSTAAAIGVSSSPVGTVESRGQQYIQYGLSIRGKVATGPESDGWQVIRVALGHNIMDDLRVYLNQMRVELQAMAALEKNARSELVNVSQAVHGLAVALLGQKDAPKKLPRNAEEIIQLMKKMLERHEYLCCVNLFEHTSGKRRSPKRRSSGRNPSQRGSSRGRRGSSKKRP